MKFRAKGSLKTPSGPIKTPTVPTPKVGAKVGPIGVKAAKPMPIAKIKRAPVSTVKY